MSTGRRPILSATMLKTSDPSSTPKLAAANTGPSGGAATPQSRDDGRRDVAHRLDVEAVHDQADHAQDEDPYLQRADRLFSSSSPMLIVLAAWPGMLIKNS